MSVPVASHINCFISDTDLYLMDEFNKDRILHHYELIWLNVTPEGVLNNSIIFDFNLPSGIVSLDVLKRETTGLLQIIATKLKFEDGYTIDHHTLKLTPASDIPQLIESPLCSVKLSNVKGPWWDNLIESNNRGSNS